MASRSGCTFDSSAGSETVGPPPGHQAPGDRRQHRGTAARLRRLLTLSLLLLGGLTRPVFAQDNTVRLEVLADSARTGARVRTFNLMVDTPWLTALRQGLPVQLRYRLELWRSREGWFDAVVSQIEWRIVIRHQPLLDQFAVYLVVPSRPIKTNIYPTPGTLGAALGLPNAISLKPPESGTYYYAASLNVQTLSDSDLEEFNKVIRGEIAGGGGGSLADRARRLALQLAGLPKTTLSGRSASFQVK